MLTLVFTLLTNPVSKALYKMNFKLPQKSLP